MKRIDIVLFYSFMFFSMVLVVLLITMIPQPPHIISSHSWNVSVPQKRMDMF